jgi:hypothetical protein
MEKDPHFNSLTCTTSNKKPINYTNLLNRIINGEEYTGKELEEARKAAGTWQLCSCGTLCEAIPRADEKHPSLRAPKDSKLADLGMQFLRNMASLKDAHTKYGTSSKVVKFNAERALKTHLAIEKRAGQILDEIFTPPQWIEYINRNSKPHG